MNPDYSKMVSEFLTPTVATFLFIFFIGSLAIGYQIWKDLMKVRDKLGDNNFNYLMEDK